LEEGIRSRQNRGKTEVK
jgi:hypothetical protein